MSARAVELKRKALKSSAGESKELKQSQEVLRKENDKLKMKLELLRDGLAEPRAHLIRQQQRESGTRHQLLEH